METIKYKPDIFSKKFFVILFHFFCLLLIYRCARVGAPPGGPTDTQPPQIVETKPMHEATFVPLDAPVEVKFDEYIDKNSFESAFSISPPVGQVKIKWRGKSVELKHASPFLENTTYVLNLGTILKDLRNNSLLSAHTICFTTGSTIDSGTINGTVFYERSVKPEIELWAFRLNETGAFDLTTQPDYITWTANDGSFQFDFLPYDSFRVIAIEDINGDGLVTVGTENLGIASHDIHAESPPGTFNIMVGPQDTVFPYILNGESPDNQKIAVKFSKSIDIKSLEEAAFQLINFSDDIKFSKPFFTDRENRTIGIAFEKAVPPGEYKVSIANLFDIFNNPVSQDTTPFEISELNDTVLPTISETSPPRSAKQFSLDGEIRIFFSEAVKGGEFLLKDTLGGVVLGNLEHPYPNEFIFKPLGSLKEITDYRWIITGIYDFAGNQLQDTLFNRLRTLDSDTFGTLTGNIINGFYPLQMEIIKIGSDEVYRSQLVDSTISRELFPGRYNIFLYNDVDNNNRLSRGKFSPFKHSEEFWVISDTIYIRSRWETEIFYNLADE